MIKAKRFKLRKPPNLKLHNFWHEQKYKLKYLNNYCAYGFLALTHFYSCFYFHGYLAPVSCIPMNSSKNIWFSVSSFIRSWICVACLWPTEILISRYTKPKTLLSFIIYQACIKLTNNVTRHRGCRSSLHHFSHSSDFTIEQISHGKVGVISLRSLSPRIWTFYRFQCGKKKRGPGIWKKYTSISHFTVLCFTVLHRYCIFFFTKWRLVLAPHQVYLSVTLFQQHLLTLSLCVTSS